MFCDSLAVEQQKTIELQEELLCSQQETIDIQKNIIVVSDSIHFNNTEIIGKYVTSSNYYQDLYEAEKPKKWYVGGAGLLLLVLTIIAVK